MYRNFEELCAQAEKNSISLHEAALQSEMQLAGKTEQEIYDRLNKHWQVMKKSAFAALDKPQKMPAGLIEGSAQKQNEYSMGESLAGAQINSLMALALSASEVNASMGQICAAPTAGACGILPAVLISLQASLACEEKQILDALLLSGAIGTLIMKNATVSGAKGGCQAECGSAAAMAAAAAAYIKGGTNAQIGNAVSIAFMNCLGLVCDPIGGLVQLPCAFRNASQAVNALISADLALAGQNPVVSADEAIEAMYKTGKRLPPELRETAKGGMAACKSAEKVDPSN